VNEVQLTRRLRMLESVENGVSAVLATAVAGLYFWYRYKHGVIAVYSWSIPFLVVGGAAKFAFALAEARIEGQLRAGREPAGLPGARIVSSGSPRAVTPVPTVAPQPAPPAPPAPGQEPSLLK
jgi:hypothetical protein